MDYSSRYSFRKPHLAVVNRPQGSNTLGYTVLYDSTTRLESKTPIEFRAHVWSESDRLDLVAARYLGDPSLWWMVMDYNPLIPDPLHILPGTVLNVPVDAPVLIGDVASPGEVSAY